MDTNLTGRVALVTGGSQGIGRSIADRLSAAGATVAIAALPTESLERTSSEYLAKGVPFRSYAVDIADATEAAGLVDAVARDLGPIDILISNAGMTGPTARVDQMPLEEWSRTLDLNLTAPFVLCKAVAPAMMDRRSGKIITISSIAGKMAYPLRTPYAASKWGLVGLTLSIAQELGPFNVQVNAICPGPTRTDMIERVIHARAESQGKTFDETYAEFVRATALRRMVLPEEVADLALFLSSPAADGITGQAIEISAGYGFRIGD